MNKQREIIYKERRSVLQGENIKENITNMIKNTVDSSVMLYTADSDYPEEWDLEGLKEHLYNTFLPKGCIEFNNIEDLDRDKIKEDIMNRAYEYVQSKGK